MVGSHKQTEGVRSQVAPHQAEQWPHLGTADIRSHRTKAT